MLQSIHQKKNLQLFAGLCIGIIFGFLLQKGGVTIYDIIMGQLLLTDFTVLKIMLTAVLTGMTGVYILKAAGLAVLHPKTGAWGSSAVGGLIFGVGFALLGYCPGTIAGAAGHGALDALYGGIPGIIFGCGVYAALYPAIEKHILHRGEFGAVTFPQLLKVNPWAVIIPVSIGIALFLMFIERAGL